MGLVSYTISIRDPSEGPFEFNCDLDGKSYRFLFLYNQREGFWYFDVYDQVGNPIRTGVKAVVNFPLLLRCSESNRPVGELLFMNSRLGIDDPGLADLGADSELVYWQNE